MDVFHAYYTSLMDSSGPSSSRRRYKKLNITLGNEQYII